MQKRGPNAVFSANTLRGMVMLRIYTNVFEERDNICTFKKFSFSSSDGIARSLYGLMTFTATFWPLKTPAHTSELPPPATGYGLLSIIRPLRQRGDDRDQDSYFGINERVCRVGDVWA